MASREHLIDQLLEETVRARRRRLNITRALDVRLLGLKTVDAKLDRNIRALALFGSETLNAAAGQLAATTHAPTADALVHVMAACAVQATGASIHDDLLERLHDLYGQRHRSALRDAWWFYPLNRSRFDLHRHRIASMLRAGRIEQRLMAIELAGRLGMADQAPPIAQAVAATPDGLLHRTGELALCRMGHAPANLPTRVQTLAQGPDEDSLHALRLMADSGRPALLPARQFLAWAKSPQAPLARLAWCLAAVSDPAAAHEAAVGDRAMDADLRTRVLALAGYPDGLIAIAQEIAAEDSPARPAQLDALAMFLGEIPMEVAAKPINPAQREEALRAAVLKAFRAAHVPVSNEAKACAWSARDMLADAGARSNRRLRYGGLLRPREAGGMPLGNPVLQMGPLMRQALYIEQSAQAGRPIGAGLSAYAATRHQLDVIGVSQWFGRAAVAAA